MGLGFDLDLIERDLTPTMFGSIELWIWSWLLYLIFDVCLVIYKKNIIGFFLFLSWNLVKLLCWLPMFSLKCELCFWKLIVFYYKWLCWNNLSCPNMMTWKVNSLFWDFLNFNFKNSFKISTYFNLCKLMWLENTRFP